MSVQDQVGESPHQKGLKIAAPAGAAAMLAVAGVVGISLTLTDGRNNNDVRFPEAAQSTRAPPPPAPMPMPGGLPGIAQNQVGGAGGVELGMEIVVKFKDDAKVKDICDTFWRDADEARSKFNRFKSDWPVMSGMRLDRVTYSNELVLVSSNRASIPAMRKAASDMQALAEISYAEPNPTAHPGDR